MRWHMRQEAAPHDVDAVVAQIAAAIAIAVPSMADDAEIRRAVEVTALASLPAIAELLADPTRPSNFTPPPETETIVTTVVRRGLALHDLIEAARVAQNAIWHWWLEQLTATVPPGPALITAIETSSRALAARVDFLVAYMRSRWELESEEWRHGAQARRAGVVRRLLSSAPPSLAEASRELSYDLDRTLTAAVVWDRGDAGRDHAPELEAVAGTLAVASGADRALTVSAGASTLWAWIGTREPPDMAALAAAARTAAGETAGVALGMPAPGGFRTSHDEAQRARAVADLTGAPVVEYHSVEIVSLLAGDLERLKPFVRRALGCLITPDDSTARVRDTLGAWLDAGLNASRAAERIGVHKNTVLYRLTQAERMRGRPLGDDRVALELALCVVDTLGPGRFIDLPENVRASG